MERGSIFVIVSERTLVAILLALSITLKVKLDGPKVANGVPLILPVDELRVRFAGSNSDVIDQE